MLARFRVDHVFQWIGTHNSIVKDLRFYIWNLDVLALLRVDYVFQSVGTLHLGFKMPLNNFAGFHFVSGMLGLFIVACFRPSLVSVAWPCGVFFL